MMKYATSWSTLAIEMWRSGKCRAATDGAYSRHALVFLCCQFLLDYRFIEFMPFSGNKWDDSKLVPYREALRAVFQRHPQTEPAPPRDNDTARVSGPCSPPPTSSPPYHSGVCNPRLACRVAGVARAGLRGQRGLHLVHDAALLLHVQQAAADGGRQPEGVPVRRGGGVATRSAARGRRRRRAHGAGARRSRQQEGAPRRYAADTHAYTHTA